jgi:type IV secretory pathway protease TraF
MDSRKIATIDVATGMQVKSAGLWWQITKLVDNGRTDTAVGVWARRVRNNGYPTAAAPVVVWLPISAAGTEARPGAPAETTVIDRRKTVRVHLDPRHVRDPQPYVAPDGSRYARTETAAQRRIDGLADAFESRLTA